MVAGDGLECVLRCRVVEYSVAVHEDGLVVAAGVDREAPAFAVDGEEAGECIVSVFVDFGVEVVGLFAALGDVGVVVPVVVEVVADGGGDYVGDFEGCCFESHCLAPFRWGGQFPGLRGLVR